MSRGTTCGRHSLPPTAKSLNDEDAHLESLGIVSSVAPEVGDAGSETVIVKEWKRNRLVHAFQAEWTSRHDRAYARHTKFRGSAFPKLQCEAKMNPGSDPIQMHEVQHYNI